MERMITRVLPADEESIRLGGEMIARGELVGFPTETVYGLGATPCARKPSGPFSPPRDGRRTIR